MDTVEQPAVHTPVPQVSPVVVWSIEQHPARAAPYCPLEMAAPLPGPLLSSHPSLPTSLTLLGFLHLCGSVQVFLS